MALMDELIQKANVMGMKDPNSYLDPPSRTPAMSSPMVDRLLQLSYGLSAGSGGGGKTKEALTDDQKKAMADMKKKNMSPEMAEQAARETYQTQVEADKALKTSTTTSSIFGPDSQYDPVERFYNRAAQIKYGKGEHGSHSMTLSDPRTAEDIDFLKKAYEDNTISEMMKQRETFDDRQRYYDEINRRGEYYNQLGSGMLPESSPLQQANTEFLQETGQVISPSSFYGVPQEGVDTAPPLQYEAKYAPLPNLPGRGSAQMTVSGGQSKAASSGYDPRKNLKDPPVSWVRPDGTFGRGPSSSNPTQKGGTWERLPHDLEAYGKAKMEKFIDHYRIKNHRGWHSIVDGVANKKNGKSVGFTTSAKIDIRKLLEQRKKYLKDPTNNPEPKTATNNLAAIMSRKKDGSVYLEDKVIYKTEPDPKTGKTRILYYQYDPDTGDPFLPKGKDRYNPKKGVALPYDNKAKMAFNELQDIVREMYDNGQNASTLEKMRTKKWGDWYNDTFIIKQEIILGLTHWLLHDLRSKTPISR